MRRLATPRLAVALGALVVHDLGAAPLFPMAAAALALAILAGLSQRCWREVGAPAPQATAGHRSGIRQPGAPPAAEGIAEPSS